MTFTNIHTPAIPSPLAPSTGTGSGTDVETAHKVLVGVLVMIVMLVILTDVAGESHKWATIVGLLLLGPLLIEGFHHTSNLTTWLQANPYNPNT